MESTSMPMHIQATKSTVELLDKTKWQCVKRGLVEVKASILQFHPIKMHLGPRQDSDLLGIAANDVKQHAALIIQITTIRRTCGMMAFFPLLREAPFASFSEVFTKSLL